MNLEFKLVGSIELVPVAGEEFYETYYDTYYDSVTELIARSSLFKVTEVNGTIHYAAALNFNMGKCDCCRNIGLSDGQVSKIEGFVVV